MRRPSWWRGALGTLGILSCGLALSIVPRGSAQQAPRRGRHAARRALSETRRCVAAMAAAGRRRALRRDRRQADAQGCRRADADFPALSRRGHPKFWGRITGTSSDAESAEWLAAKFKAAGLSDVRIQPLDLEPQWMPQTWDVVVTGGGKTVRIESAQPFYGANALPAGGVDVEAVYAGLGSEADFAGKNVTRQSGVRVQPDGPEGRRSGPARRRQGRGRHLRSRHAARQHALPGVSVRHQRAGVHRRERRRLCGARSDRGACRPARPRGSRRASRCRACRT